ncbi:MAG: hypothetical protein R2685_10665 [Candidatus Nitrosocosmicus sp.]|nr:hypothetical protein [Candidatus Nitrosocosmicus sp.]
MFALNNNRLIQFLRGKKQLSSILDLDSNELDGITRSALWDKNDYDKHVKYVQLINSSTRQNRGQLINNFIEHLDYLYNDHRTHKLEPYKYPHQQFESFGVSKNHNKTIIYGCMRHAELITEESTERFYWMASGTSVEQVPLAIDQKLNSENFRTSLKDSGFLFSNGNVIMEHGIFPTNIIDALIKEFGAVDKPSVSAPNQTWEWHSIIKYSNEYHDHKQGQTYYTGSHALELRSSNKD